MRYKTYLYSYIGLPHTKPMGWFTVLKIEMLEIMILTLPFIPLSNRTNFNGCTRWSSSVWKVFADELPVNTDETPMNFWAKVTHLDPYSLIESSSVVRGEEIRSERLPGEHRWKCRWSFGYCALPQRTLPVELLACWRRHSRLNDFHRCSSAFGLKGWKKNSSVFYERNSPRWFIGSSTGKVVLKVVLDL